MYMRNRYNRHRHKGSCNECRDCKMPDVMPQNPQLANSYVPYQYIDETLCPIESLANGTTFPELVSPYTQNQSQCIIQYLKQTNTCEEEADTCGR